MCDDCDLGNACNTLVDEYGQEYDPFNRVDADADYDFTFGLDDAEVPADVLEPSPFECGLECDICNPEVDPDIFVLDPEEVAAGDSCGDCTDCTCANDAESFELEFAFVTQYPGDEAPVVYKFNTDDDKLQAYRTYLELTKLEYPVESLPTAVRNIVDFADITNVLADIEKAVHALCYLNPFYVVVID